MLDPRNFNLCRPSRASPSLLTNLAEMTRDANAQFPDATQAATGSTAHR